MQLYCTSDLRIYKLVRVDENWNRHIKTENGIKLNNGFDLHMDFLNAVDYVRRIANKIFPQNYSLEMEIFKRSLHSDNGEAKAQGDL